MFRAFFSVLTFFFLTGYATSCRHEQPMPDSEGQKPTKEQMIHLNRDIVTDEATNIRLLIKRYGWDMQKTESGLFYEITSHKNGPTLQKGDKVMLKYRITLLNGETLYSSDNDGLMEVVLEKSDNPVGLHQALKMMKRGETARLIIPAHLGYGSIGDGDRIPGFSPLIYYIEIQ